MLLGLVFTVSAKHYSTSELELGARFALVYANFLLAIPMLAVLAGPFVLRVFMWKGFRERLTGGQLVCVDAGRERAGRRRSGLRDTRQQLHRALGRDRVRQRCGEPVGPVADVPASG
jgi:hypothetical protein